MKDYRFIYLVVLVVMISDLVIALYGIVRAMMGINEIGIVMISLANVAIFAMVFLDGGEDVYQEEIDKRMSEALQDYKLEKNSFSLKEN